MERRFNFDSTGATFIAGIFLFGFLLMFVLLFIEGRFGHALLAALPMVTGLIFIWLALSKGTYVSIDRNKDTFRTSGLFFSRSIPLSSITKLEMQGMFAEIMKRTVLTYQDKSGNTKVLNSMTRESFKKGEFDKFISTLKSANPNISVSND